MPSFNNVSYNSSRVQRAYRINNIETLKLNNKIHLLEKERLHRQRITNQDIRLISLTLDYIQTSSGHSLEGLAPDGDSDSRSEYDDDKKDEGPCFMYGERIVSRKKRRTIRPQSAMDKSMSKHSSETASVVSTSDVSIRPQSSPVRTINRPFVTQIKDHETEVGFEASESSNSGISTPRFRPAWVDEPPSDVTKILLRAASSDANRRMSFLERTKRERGGDRGLDTISRSMRIKSRSSSQRQNVLPRRSLDTSEPEVGPMGRHSSGRISDILNNGKAPLSASYWKNHLSNTHSSPVTSSKQKQFAMETKRSMERSRTEVVDLKVKRFVSSQ